MAVYEVEFSEKIDEKIQTYVLNDNELHLGVNQTELNKVLKDKNVFKEDSYRINCVIHDVEGNLQKIFLGHKKGFQFYQYKNFNFTLISEFKDHQSDKEYNKNFDCVKILNEKLFSNEFKQLFKPFDDNYVKMKSDLSIWKEGGENNRQFEAITKLFCCNQIETEKWSRIFMADLTGQEYEDVVYMNNTGMYVYQFENKKSDYNLIHYHPSFAEIRGWKPEYLDTIVFRDVYMDPRKEMIFTGPQGLTILSYDYYFNEWNSILDLSEVSVLNKYSKVIDVISFNGEAKMLVKVSDDSYKWGKIKRKNFNVAQITTTTEPDDIEKMIPLHIDYNLVPRIASVANDIIDQDKSEIFLSEHFDDFSRVIDAIHKISDKPVMSFPIIDFRNAVGNIKLGLVYNGNLKAAGILGKGWSLQYTNSFITRDYRSDFFSQDDNFMIVIENVQLILKYDADSSFSKIKVFNFDSNETENISARYFVEDERWEIQLKGVKQIYGRRKENNSSNLSAINWNLGWDLWRGRGMSTEGQKQIATSWYLSEIRDASGNYIQFDYDVVNESTESDKMFTREVYLKQIKDNFGSTVSLSYNDKEDEEFPKIELRDSEGFYDTRLVCRKYLSEITAVTRTTKQTVGFVYIVNDSKTRLLVDVTEGYLRAPVLQFKYDQLNFNIMNKLIFIRSGTTVNFQYKTISYEDINQSKRLFEKKIGFIEDNYAINYEQDFILVSFLDAPKTKITLKMFERDLSKEIIPFDRITNKNQWPKIVANKILEYQIIKLQNAFTVVVTTAQTVMIYLFNKTKTGDWVTISEPQTFNKQSILASGNTFMTLLTDKSYIVLYFDNDNWSIEEIPIKILFDRKMTNVIIGAAESNFFLYDDQNLQIGYKDFEGEWKYKAVRDVIKKSIDTIEKLKLPEEVTAQYIKMYKSYALQSYDNIVVLSGLDCDKDGFLKTTINLVVLNEYRNIAQFEFHEVRQDSISSFKSEFKNANNKVFYLSNKIRKYAAVLSGQSIICNNRKFIFTGHDWKENVIPEERIEELSIPLGESYILEKEKVESSYKLYWKNEEKDGQKELRFDLGIKHLNETQIRYPFYLAYQKSGGNVDVIEFLDKNATYHFSYPNKEKLSPYTGFRRIVTVKDHSLVFKSDLDVKRLLPTSVCTSSEVIYDKNYKRITGYEYNTNSIHLLGNVVSFEQWTMIPGNDRNLFGWVENYSKNSSVNIFDGNGDLIKTYQQKPRENDSENSTETSGTVLFDKSGKYKVAEFAPYNLKDDVVGYFGFEDYELSDASKWNFNESNIVRHNFSFTGQNYLRLKDNKIERVFEPTYQDFVYVASCWMRSSNDNEVPFQLGLISSYLKVNVISDKENYPVLSQVKIQEGNWFYLEALVDLSYIKQLKLNKKLDSDTKLKLKLEVSSEKEITLDLDHIRFSPLDCKFKAQVYNPITTNLIDVIQTSGLHKRLIYDKYQRQIAEIGEFGQVKNFLTYSKQSTRQPDIPKSVVQIESNGGSYEMFDVFSFQEIWSVSNPKLWQIQRGQIEHFGNGSNYLKTDLKNIDLSSFAFRFMYHLKNDESLIRINQDIELLRHSNGADIVYNGHVTVRYPLSFKGELITVLEGERIFIWVDGNLLIEQKRNVATNNMFILDVNQNVQVSDFMLFDRPKVHVTYFNGLGEKLQEIVLENDNSAICVHFMYDKIGRHDIVTKPTRITTKENGSLLMYKSDFVKNDNPYEPGSIWKTGKLKGISSKLNGKFGFSWTKYANNILNRKTGEGLNGNEFRSGSVPSSQFRYKTDNTIINNLFPINLNYTHNVEVKADTQYIKVLNQRDKQVGKFVNLSDDYLLATYEYNESGKLIKILPPVYHDRVKTRFKNHVQFMNVTAEEMELQKKVGSHFIYDKEGNLVRRITPETGRTEFLYNKNNVLLYIVHYSNGDNRNIVDNITYFDYNEIGRLIETGYLKKSPSLDVNNLINTIVDENEKVKYQSFYYSDFEKQPILRSKITRSITRNDNFPHIEEIISNYENKPIRQRILVSNRDTKNQTIILEVQNKYKGENIDQIVYPASYNDQQLVIQYKYDKFGRITGVGMPEDNEVFGKFWYNANSGIKSEVHCPKMTNSFKRNFEYNDSGFLTRIRDKYLIENVYYTEKVNGEIRRTEFNAKWHDNAKHNISLNENLFPHEIRECFSYLKKSGHIDKKNHYNKIFYPNLEFNLPLNCTKQENAQKLSKILDKHGYPVQYGHDYEYNFLRQLKEAKYFFETDDAITSHILKPITFSLEIKDFTRSDSLLVWNILVKTGFISQSVNEKITLEKFTRLIDVYTFVGNLEKYELLQEQITKYLLFTYTKGIELSKEMLHEMFNTWLPNHTNEDITNQIWNYLTERNILENPLSLKFIDVLKGYKNYHREIVRVLVKYSGDTEGDAEYFSIDDNGNYQRFRRGFKVYNLNYHSLSNQIMSVDVSNTKLNAGTTLFEMQHDSRGNVIVAAHRKIKKIEYHPVSNRPVKVFIGDDDQNSLTSKCVQFAYNARGERIVKTILDSKNRVLKEKNYIRDSNGRTLVEREMIYIAENSPYPDVVITMYIYGPKGLLGFIRRDEYYSVITDHEGSVRLIIKNGEVVAAYDYLPYGSLLREYGSYPDAHISYRYTGQEWDEELGLYNYHARLYDPEIGRFYQVDPREQFYSPYIYAANSPVSVIDPDGEFAVTLTLIILGALSGAYLGGASANKNWNPVKWNFSSYANWMSMLSGALAGSAIPFLPLSAESLAFATGASYIAGASTNDNWNPTEWDWKSPSTYYSTLSWFVYGSAGLSVVYESIEFLSPLSTTSKILFFGGDVAWRGATFYYNAGDKWKDIRSPKFWFSVASGVFYPFNFKKNAQTFKEWLSFLTTCAKSKTQLLQFTIEAAYVGGNFIATGYETNWDFTNFDTYYNLIVGIFVNANFIKTEVNKIGKNLKKVWEHVLKIREEENQRIYDEIPDAQSSQIIIPDNALNGPILPSESTEIEAHPSTSSSELTTHFKESFEKHLRKLISKFRDRFIENLLNPSHIPYEILNDVVTEIESFVEEQKSLSHEKLRKIISEKIKKNYNLAGNSRIQDAQAALNQARTSHPEDNALILQKQANLQETKISLQNVLSREATLLNEVIWTHLSYLNEKIAEWIPLQSTITLPLQRSLNSAIQLHTAGYKLSDFIFTSSSYVGSFISEELLGNAQNSNRMIIKTSYGYNTNLQWLIINVNEWAQKYNPFTAQQQILDYHDSMDSLPHTKNPKIKKSGIHHHSNILNIDSHNQINFPKLDDGKKSTSTINEVDASYVSNSLILLLDTLVRKITDKKPIPKNDPNLSLLDAQGHALNIVDKFEKITEKAASKSRLTKRDIQFDQISLMPNLVYHLVNGTYTKIPKVLQDAIEYSTTDSERTNRFSKYLKKYTEKMTFKN